MANTDNTSRRPATGVLSIACCCCFLLLGACGGDDSTSRDASMVTDDLDRTVYLDKPVRRAVSLAPGVTEIVHSAGAFDRLIGVTTVDDFPAGVDSLARISALPVDFESIVMLEADLVLATTQVNNPQNARTLSSLGISTYFFSAGSVEQILDAILNAGHLFDTSEAAEESVRSLRSDIDQLQHLTENVDVRPTVIVLISARTPYSFGPESYVHDLVDWAGGTSLTADFPSEAPNLTEEFVLDAAPDVIIGTFGPEFSPEVLLENHPAWAHTPALKNGRVYSLAADPLLRAGPRVVQAAWEMARLLHPELFDEARQ